MRLIFVLSTLGALLQHGSSSEQKLKHKIAKYNLLSKCFGEQAMMAYTTKLYKAMEFCNEIQSPMFSPSLGLKPYPPSLEVDQLAALQDLLRSPAVLSFLQRQEASLPLDGWEETGSDDDDEEELMEDVVEFKQGMMEKMGNLTCVLTQLEMIDTAGNINMQHFSLESLTAELTDSPAGSDPVFIEKLATGFSDCQAISDSWPQTSINRHPVAKNFGNGRQMIFLECAKKVQAKTCTQFQLSQWLEQLFGDYMNADLDLLEDKYDAAEVAIKAMYSASSSVERFVDDFFWQSSKF